MDNGWVDALVGGCSSGWTSQCVVDGRVDRLDDG